MDMYCLVSVVTLVFVTAVLAGLAAYLISFWLARARAARKAAAARRRIKADIRASGQAARRAMNELSDEFLRHMVENRRR